MRKGYVEVTALTCPTSDVVQSPPAVRKHDLEPKEPSTAMRAILRLPGRAELPLTLAGTIVIVGDGKGRVVQTLDSEKIAREHFERVMTLRQKEGFVLVETKQISSDDFCMPDKLELEGIEGVSSFMFDTFFQTQACQGRNALGNIAAVLRAYPNFERFYATGNLFLSKIQHQQLRALHLLGDPLSLQLSKPLALSSFPSLETIALSFAFDSGPIDDDFMFEVPFELIAPQLANVHLAGIGDVPRMLSLMAQRGLPKSWKHLSLAGTWDGAYETADMRPILEAHGASLQGLESLALTLEHEDDVAEIQTIVAALTGNEGAQNAYLPQAYEDW